MSFITITTNGEFGNTHQTFNTENGGHMKALALAAMHIHNMIPKAQDADGPVRFTHENAAPNNEIILKADHDILNCLCDLCCNLRALRDE